MNRKALSGMILAGGALCMLIVGCPPQNVGGGNDNTMANVNDNTDNGNDNGPQPNENQPANENEPANDNEPVNENTEDNANDNLPPVECTVATQEVDCDDGNDCTADLCVADACVNNPIEDCCDSNDDCNDGVACTLDSCDLTTNLCVFSPSDAACDDGLFCNGDETCDPEDAASDESTGCLSGTAPCVEALCDEDNDLCDLCTDNTECDDGVACTVDTCDTGTGLCTNAPDNSVCDDTLFCTGTETCDPAGAGADPVTGCVASGNPCSGTTPVCDETLQCVACAVDEDCDDGVDCTQDACNVGTGECVNTPDHGSCDDGLFCTGTESCDPAAGCVATGNPCSNPTPVCDEVNDSCGNCDDNGDCADADDCTIDTCDAGSCSNVSIDCNDGDGCTIDACVAGVCENTLVSPDCCDADNDCAPGESCNLTNNLCEEANVQVGCTDQGFSQVTVTLFPFPGTSPPDPLPTESFTIVDGDPFGVVVSIGDLGNNEDVFMIVTLDDNEVNGNPGDLFGQIFPFFIESNTDYEVFGQAEPGTEGTFNFVATLYSGATNDAGCSNVGQSYNSTVQVTILP